MTPKEIQAKRQQAYDLKHAGDVILRELADAERQEKDTYWEKLESNFKFTDDHRRLLKRLHFKFYPDGGDLVFIGVDGKRPFGNSSIYKDVARILEWRLPNYDLSDEQMLQAEKLLDELAFAVNHVMKNL